MSVIRYCQFYT